MQSVLPAIYPILKASFALDFGQIGLITLTTQMTASVLQPVVGLYTDSRPTPFSLPVGMGFTLTGMVLLATAANFPMILVAAGLVGIGSAVFHPESSRVARMASGGQHGLAQSLFQVGGNAGSAMGPLLAAFIVLPNGQHSISWFGIAAVIAILVLIRVGVWYKRHPSARRGVKHAVVHPNLSRRKIATSLAVLIALIFSKYFYLASIVAYYTFFLIHRFGVSVQSAQIHLFLFLGAVAVGTVIGGPVGDRVWAQVRDLGVDPRRAAVHVDTAVCESVLDRRVNGDHRTGAGFRVLGDSGVRAGSDAGESGHDFGTVLRARIWNGRDRRGVSGACCRCYRDRVRVQSLFVPAGDRHPDRVPAQSGTTSLGIADLI